MAEPRCKVASAYVFANGMVMAFDADGQQAPEYQGPKDEVVPKLQRDFPDLQIGGLAEPIKWCKQ
jgi:hypothetical protein